MHQLAVWHIFSLLRIHLLRADNAFQKKQKRWLKSLFYCHKTTSVGMGSQIDHFPQFGLQKPLLAHAVPAITPQPIVLESYLKHQKMQISLVLVILKNWVCFCMETSANSCTRELFKPSKDLAILCVCNEKKFPFWFFFFVSGVISGLHLALGPNR